MAEFFDTSGNKISLERRIGSGGEGSVYFVDGDNARVAKVYHERPDDEKREKLEWMHRHRKDEFAKFAVWIHDLLFDKPDGELVGFIMPHVNAKEIHELYSLKSRKVHFPQATWHFLLHVSSNISRAFYALHSHNHLMGDVNHGNCVILPDGTVKLIDCDSFGLNTGEEEYFCEVGVATHLAPELQGQDLSTTPRTQAHDNFGLAVMIFQLLFLGRHPFAGNVKGEVDLPLEECIRKQLFAYSDKGQSRGIIQPPGTLRLSDLTPALASLFERAFMTLDDRPEPAEWIEALQEVLENLAQCAAYPGHQYPATSKSCPWCRIESQTGLVLFPFVATDVAKVGSTPFDILSVENLVDALENPRALIQNAKDTPVKLDENSPAVSIARHVRIVRGGLVATLFFVVLIAMAIWGVGAAGMVGFILLIPFIITATTYKSSYRNQLRSKMAQIQSSLQQSAGDIEKLTGNSVNKKELKLVRDKLDHYKILSLQLDDKTNQDALKEVSSELGYYPIPEEALSELTAHSKSLVHSSGMRTAADITPTNLEKVPLLKTETKGALVAWKNFLVDSLRNKKSESALEPYRASALIGIEYEINMLVRKLSLMPVGKNQNFEALSKKVTDANKQLAYMGAEFKRIGDGSLTAALLFVIAVFTPFVGAIGSEIMFASPPPPYEESYDSDYGYGSGVGSGSGSGVKTVRADADTVEVPEFPDPDNLGPIESKKVGKELWSKGVEKRNNGNYFEAVRHLEKALEFDDSRQYRVDLGVGYYFQGDYKKAVVEFKTAQKEKDTDYALQYLAMSYFEDGKFSEAVDSFEKLVARTPNDKNHLNLGLAYNADKKYQKAVEVLKKVKRGTEEEKSSVYTLGLVYSELDDRKSLLRQYNRLKEIDPANATVLGEETGILEPKKKEVIMNMNEAPALPQKPE